MIEKRDCSDFIISTARKIRKEPPNIKLGSCSGVKLTRIYEIVVASYTDCEIRKGLEILLEKGSVMLIAHGFVVTWVKGRKMYPFRDRRMLTISDSTPLDKRVYLDREGLPVDRHSKYVRESISKILLYVVEDGLPQKVCKERRLFTKSELNQS